VGANIPIYANTRFGNGEAHQPGGWQSALTAHLVLPIWREPKAGKNINTYNISMRLVASG
jgi:hypothetical protein